MRQPHRATSAVCIALCLLLPVWPAAASSHREAPAITERPAVDGTDFYMFRSFEEGHTDSLILIANYYPLQDAYGGPNYFPLDKDAFYDIHIDNNGDCSEDLTFRFRYGQTSPFIALSIGEPGSELSVPIPLSNAGVFGAGDEAALNVQRSYRINLIQGSGPITETGAVPIINTNTDSVTFPMPFDNIGTKSIPDYAGYAAEFVHPIAIPGCELPGRVFVGQRKEPFAVNLGEIFDLVNLDAAGPEDTEVSSLADKNVTSFVLEVPIACVTAESEMIAGWTTAKLRQNQVILRNARYNNSDRVNGPRVQVSRLGQPLINEIVIGLPDKDRFNGSRPVDDAQFLDYVTHPTLPELLEILFAGGVVAPNLFPRTDLVQVFLTGIPGLNQDGGTCEVLRLNTSTPPVAPELQSNLGLLGGDVAGYPNGRRPGDDVVDISLRVAMGVLLAEESAPSGGLQFTDGVLQNALQFDPTFPFLTTPVAGSPNDTGGVEKKDQAGARKR